MSNWTQQIPLKNAIVLGKCVLINYRFIVAGGRDSQNLSASRNLDSPGFYSTDQRYNAYDFAFSGRATLRLRGLCSVIGRRVLVVEKEEGVVDEGEYGSSSSCCRLALLCLLPHSSSVLREAVRAHTVPRLSHNILMIFFPSPPSTVPTLRTDEQKKNIK